jgi:tellurite resistance-related uncharacterized protein
MQDKLKRVRKAREILTIRRDSKRASHSPQYWHMLTAKIDEIDLQLDMLRRGLEVEQT